MARVMNTHSSPDLPQQAPQESTTSNSLEPSESVPQLNAPDSIRHGHLSARELMRVLASLRWTLTKRSFQGSAARILGSVFQVMAAASILAALVIVFLVTTVVSGSGEAFPQIIRGAGAIAVLLALLVPLLATGIDDVIDVRRIAMLPLNGKRLRPGLLLAGLISIRGPFIALGVVIATVFEVIWLLAFGPSAGWVIAALVVLVPANAAAAVLCFLLPQAVLTWASTLTLSRRTREALSVGGLIGIIAIIYGMILLTEATPFATDRSTGVEIAIGGDGLGTVIDIAAWTPFGAPFAIPMDVAEGRVIAAIIRTAITALTLAALWVWWERSLDRALNNALLGEAGSGSTAVTPLVPRIFPHNAWGAVAGRSLKYWRRDSRYLTAVSVFPLILVFLIAVGVITPEAQFMPILGLLLLAGLTGLVISNEFGFDGPSGWVNITAGLSARANLFGRVAACAMLMVPLLLVGSAAICVALGFTHWIPIVLLFMIGTSATSFGVAVLAAVFLPYRTSPPGTNPLKDKSANQGIAIMSSIVAMVAIPLFQTPALVLGILSITSGSMLAQIGTGAVSVLTGAVVWAIGFIIGSRALDKRYPEIFATVRDFL